MKWIAAALLTCSLQAQPYLISTVAGGTPLPTPVAAFDASISPAELAVDSPGNIYFSSRHAIYKLAGNVITRIAGTGRPGFSGDGGPALDAQFNDPAALALDRAGNLYIADTSNNRVRRIS